jgi:NAD+ synthase (glutamine-hydrolysing)
MTLAEILAGEISPELVPVENGEKLQSTEAAIGRYELQDFGLLYTLRFGFRPLKIACMALHAWKDERAGEWPPGFPPTGGARTESVKFGLA